MKKSLQPAGVASAVTGFRLFLDLVRDRAPEVRKVLYLAIHPSPSDEPLRPFIDAANAGLRRLCAASRLALFVDYLHLLLDPSGRPLPSRFQSDGLHFAPSLYRDLAAFLRPMLNPV